MWRPFQVSVGGWRGAQYDDYRSCYRVFLRAGQAAPVEMTSAFLGGARSRGVFENGRSGTDTYNAVRDSCVAEMERILQEEH